MTVAAFDAWTIDGRTPAQVITPSTSEQVAEALAAAAAEGRAVVPWGGGVHQGLGRPPQRYDAVLCTSGLDRVLDHAPADMTVSVEAGVTLDALQNTLAPHGQMVALESAYPGRATLGGILAVAATGPRRLGFGEPRDQVIGIAVAQPDGTVTRAGGSVVKNVTGYEMTRLYTGSLGTLGVIVEVSLRLRPLPGARATLLASFGSAQAPLQVITTLRRSPLQPVALNLLDPEAATALPGGVPVWTLALEFAAGPAAVARQVQEATAICQDAGGRIDLPGDAESGQFWAAVRDLGRSPQRPWLIARMAVPPAYLSSALEAVDKTVRAEAALPPAVVCRAGSGLLYACWRPEAVPGATRWDTLIAALRERALLLGGSLVVEQTPAAMPVDVDRWGPPNESFAIMQRLKQQFDPQRVLNPGRFVGGL